MSDELTVRVLESGEPIEVIIDELTLEGAYASAARAAAIAAAAGASAAGAARLAIENLGVLTNTLETGASATVTKTVDPVTGVVTLTFGIPRGPKGDPGDDGVSVTSVTLNNDYTLTFTMSDGNTFTTTSVRGPEGDPGNPGDPGDDGFSPVVTVTTITGGHRVSITDANGTQTFDVMDGEGGTTITVDSALSSTSENPVQNKVIKSALDAKGTYSKPSGGIPKTDLANAVQTSLGKADSAYQKPSGGIPKTDLASAVQSSLDLADSALQSYTETDPTVPSWAKANTKPTYSKSEVGLGNVDNTSDANKPISTATQTALNGKANVLTEQTITTAGAVTQALTSGVLYHFTGALTSLTVTLTAPASGIAHYHFDFLAGTTAPTLTMPNTVTMPDDFAVEASKRYEVDVLNNFGAVISWAN